MSSEWIEDSWLVLAYPQNPVIRFDSRILDRVLAEGTDLIMTVDETTGVVGLASGPERAMEFANELAAYTRSAPITRDDAYEDAKRRLEALRANPQAIETRPALYFGSKAIIASAEILYVGEDAFSLTDLEELAIEGRAIALDGGAIRAALPKLIVAARARSEDPARLLDRIQTYELRRAEASDDRS